MPAAGRGSRFSVAGHALPKPIIQVQGRPMAAWPLACLSAFVPDCRPVIVVLREHVDEFGIDAILQEQVPRANICIAESPTAGSLETCMLAHDAVTANGGSDAPLVVLDSDLAFRSDAFIRDLTTLAAERIEGALLSFPASDARYSFAEVKDGWVTRTAEKDPISNHALVGAYGFARASQFFEIGQEIIASNARVANGEFYTSAAYNILIARGGRVRLSDIEGYWSMGTPDELSASLADPGFSVFLEEISVR
jgi:dTDP-glucose pyrophosphorylase